MELLERLGSSSGEYLQLCLAQSQSLSNAAEDSSGTEIEEFFLNLRCETPLATWTEKRKEPILRSSANTM